MVSCEDGTSEIAQAIGETNEITEAKEETNEVAEAKRANAEQIRHKLTKFKEENGVVALRRLFVKKMIDIQEKATGGDVFLFGIEENGFESAQRANALDAKLRVFHRECGKVSVELYLNRMSVGAVDTLAAKLGLFSNEYAMLFGECAKSAAELCIKKMRLGALVCKLEKRTILECEIAGARSMKKELAEKLRAFQKNLRVHELARKQDSQPYAIVQENDVGNAVMDDKQTEISKGKAYKLDAKSRIKKIRLEAFSDELEKIAEAHRLGMLKEVVERLSDFGRNLRANELARMQDSLVNAIVQQIDVEGAAMDDKATKIARGELKKMESALYDEEVRSINEVKGSTFVNESLRVLMEMMKGVKCGGKLAPGVDEAIALADAWTEAWIDMCLVKVCVGVLVDKHSIIEVLKSEIAETLKMEKEVTDRLAMYQRTYAHAQGFATVVWGEKRKDLIDKFGSVWKKLGLCAVGGAVVGIIAANALAKRKA